MTVKIGVIGTGKWGKNHIRIFSNINCKLVGLADINPKCEELAKEYKIKFFRDYHDMLPLVDCVTVVVPTDLHYNIVKDCLNAGKHVLVEKPITLEPKETKELVELAKEKKLILSVGYLFRFNPAVIELKKIINNIGKIQYIKGRYIHSSKPPRKDSGVVLNLGVHLIDILNFVLEERPRRVYCKKVNLLDIHEDSATIVLDYKDFFVELEVSCCHPLKKRDMWVIAEKEKLYIDFLEQTLDRYPLEITPEGPKEGKMIRVELLKNEPLNEELKHFLTCIDKKNNGGYKEMINIGEEEYYTTLICELALKSDEFKRDLDVE